MNSRQRLSSSFPTQYSLVELNSKKYCQHLTNWTTWNKRDKVWGSATSIFKCLFRSRRRRCCLSSLKTAKYASLWRLRKYSWKTKSLLLVKEICLLSITSNVTSNKMNFSQPLFVFAVLLIPSFNVLTDYFYVLLNLVGVSTVWIVIISWRSSFKEKGKKNDVILTCVRIKTKSTHRNSSI